MKDYVQANRRAYDMVAEEYFQRAGHSTEPLDSLVGVPLGHAQQTFSSVTALEVGPGSGEVCAYLDAHDCRTVAIDVAPRILDNVRKISPRTKTIEADISSYPLEREAYELIYCGALIHLFTKEDARGVLRNITAALKIGGILFMNTTIHNQSDEGWYEKHDYRQPVRRYRHRYTKPEFTALLTGAGVQIVDSLTTDEDELGKYWLAYVCQK